MNLNSAIDVLASIHEKELSEGVSREVVEEAEREFGVEFPADYVQYLTRLGCGFVSSEDFLGLGGEAHLDMVGVYKRLRKPSKHSRLPVAFVPLKPDGYGNYECIDIRRSSESRSAVVFWRHDGGDEQVCEVISDGFWEWFVDEIESIRGFDAEGQ